jgi:hypothetical protein
MTGRSTQLRRFNDRNLQGNVKVEAPIAHGDHKSDKSLLFHITATAALKDLTQKTSFVG